MLWSGLYGNRQNNKTVNANIQAELQSVGGKSYTLAFAIVQPYKNPFGKAKAEEKKKGKKKGIA